MNVPNIRSLNLGGRRPAAAIALATAAVALSLRAATPASSVTTAPATVAVPAIKTVAETPSIPFSSAEPATMIIIR